MPSIADPRTHTDAFHAAVAAAVSVDVGRDDIPATMPHVVVWSVDGGGLDGTIGDPDDDLVMPFRVNHVADGDQAAKTCQWLQHATRAALLAQTLTVPDRSVLRVRLESPGGVMREPDLGEKSEVRYVASDLYHLWTAP